MGGGALTPEFGAKNYYQHHVKMKETGPRGERGMRP